jgi:hypothetical protein
MESHSQHLPASAHVELAVEMVMGDCNPRPARVPFAEEPSGRKAPGRRSPRVSGVPWILHRKACPVATGSTPAWCDRPEKPRICGRDGAPLAFDCQVTWSGSAPATRKQCARRIARPITTGDCGMRRSRPGRFCRCKMGSCPGRQPSSLRIALRSALPLITYGVRKRCTVSGYMSAVG